MVGEEHASPLCELRREAAAASSGELGGVLERVRPRGRKRGQGAAARGGASSG